MAVELGDVAAWLAISAIVGLILGFYSGRGRRLMAENKKSLIGREHDKIPISPQQDEEPTELQTELGNERAEVEVLATTLRGVGTEFNTSSSKIGQFEPIEKVAVRIPELEAHITELESEREVFKSRLGKLESMEAEAAELKTRNSELEADVSRINSELDDAIAIVSRERARNKELESELAKERSSLKALMDKLDGLESERNRLSSEVEELRTTANRVPALESQIKVLESDRVALKAVLGQLVSLEKDAVGLYSKISEV